MALIDECRQQPAMANKEMKSLKAAASEDTMSLEEDEMDLSEVSDYVSSCLEDEEDDISCSTMQSESDESNDYYCSENASRVKFAKMATKYLIVSRGEYTSDEIEDTWWTPKQREVLNKNHNKTVDRLEAGLKEKKSSPYRGLEKIAIAGYHRMVDAKNAYVDAVMDEMERQWRDNDNDSDNAMLDWEAIAALTKEISKQSTQEALTIALYDESEAREAYQTIKVKDLCVPQLRQSVSSISDIDGSSIIMELLGDDGSESDEAIGKLSRMDSSIRLTKERALASPKKKKKKKAKTDKKKKKKKKSAKTSKNQDEEDESSSNLYEEEEEDLTEVEFDDDFGESDRTEGGVEPELGGSSTKKKKTRRVHKKNKKKQSSSKNDDATNSESGIVDKKKKKKKRKSQSKKTDESSDDKMSSLTALAAAEASKKDAALVVPDNKKKSPVSKFAATCVQRIRARAA